MKIGDLVKMKHQMWWRVRSRTLDYYKDCGIIYGIAGKGLKVIMPDNTIKTGIVDQWDVISESTAARQPNFTGDLNEKNN